MKFIAVSRLDLHFAADQLTHGKDDAVQVSQAITLINQTLKERLPALRAEVFAHYDEIDIDPFESNEDP